MEERVESDLLRQLKFEEMGRFVPGTTTRPTHPIRVLLHNIRSIYNVGSIFRTGDGMGVEHIYLSGYTGTPEHRALRKTALGAEEIIPWSQHQDPLEVIRAARQSGHTICALEITNKSVFVRDIRPRHFPMLLVLGHEVEGIQEDVLAACDMSVTLPQYGAKASLNVAVAFGIAAYGLVDQLERHAKETG